MGKEGDGGQKTPVQRWVLFIPSVGGGDGEGELGRRLKQSVFGKEYLCLSFRIHLLESVSYWQLASSFDAKGSQNCSRIVFEANSLETHLGSSHP